MTREQLTVPDSTRTVNQDRLDSDIQWTVLVPVPRVPVLHTKEQMSVAFPTVIIMLPGTRGICIPSQVDKFSIPCEGAKYPD